MRRPTTPYAILGMLKIAPMSGYEIRKEAASSIGYFWSESYGQLYPALRALTAKGWIRRRDSASSRGGRERQVYEITPKGREALRAWRSKAPQAVPARNELLLKLFFGDRASIGPETEWIEALESRELEALQNFRSIRSELRRQGDHPSLPFWLITLSFGEHRSRAVLRWCRETKAALQAVHLSSRPKGQMS